MSEDKTKQKVKHSESASLSSEDETTLNLAPDRPSSDSTNQSSFLNDQLHAVSIAPGKETALPDSTSTNTSAASPSRLSFKKKLSSYIKKLSPKKEADRTQSPQKSGLSVTNAVSDIKTKDVKCSDSASLSPEVEPTLNISVPDHPSSGSTHQSSLQGDQPCVVASVAVTDLQDTTLDSTSEASPSRLSFKKKISGYIKKLSPKKESTSTPSPPKLDLPVTNAMSDNETRSNVKSAFLSSEEESTLNNMVSDHPSSDSANQSSPRSGQSHVVAGVAGTEIDLQDSTLTDAGEASPSRLSFKKKVSSCIKKLSPKKEIDLTQSPQKSGLSVTSAVSGFVSDAVEHSPRSGLTNVVVGVAGTEIDLQDSTFTGAGEASPSRLSFKKKVSSCIKKLSPKKEIDPTQSPQKSGLSVTSAVGGFVSGAVELFRRSPEKTTLIDTDYECTPPPPKAEKEFYGKIDTFVDREGKRKTSVNLTDTTSLDTASEITTPSDYAGKTPETSPTEEAPLLRPDKLSKGQSPKKDNLPRNN